MTVPLRLADWMAANWSFEVDAAQPGLIRQTQRQDVKAAELFRRIDPFTVREAFWKVKDDASMIGFLNDTGVPWDSTLKAFFLSDVFRFQEFARKATVRSFSNWPALAQGSKPHVSGSTWAADAMESFSSHIIKQNGNTKDLYLQVAFPSLKQAILGTLVADRLAKNRFRLCRKPGCGMPFKIDIRERKQYCSEAHRQAEAMRRLRRKKKSSQGGK